MNVVCRRLDAHGFAMCNVCVPHQFWSVNPIMLSKSDYMLFLRHPAWLWVKKHAKHLLPPIEPSLQARFDEGHAFEPHAEQLFPDLVRLEFSDFTSYQTLPCERRSNTRPR